MSIEIVTKELSSITPFRVTSKTDMAHSVELLSRCNTYLDKLVADREKLTAPLNAALKEIRARYKPTVDKLESVIAEMRREQSAYQTALVASQKAQEQAIADKLASGAIKRVETALKQMDKVEKADKEVVAESGSVKFRTVKKFRVMDITLLPHRFLLPNEALIREEMREGRGVEGVEYYEEQVPYNSR